MIGLELDTWISLAVLVTALAGFYAALRRELHSEISGVRGEISGVRGEISGVRGEISDVRAEIADLRRELKTDINRLDDRVYALAAGMKPILEQVDRPATG